MSGMCCRVLLHLHDDQVYHGSLRFLSPACVSAFDGRRKLLSLLDAGPPLREFRFQQAYISPSGLWGCGDIQCGHVGAG